MNKIISYSPDLFSQDKYLKNEEKIILKIVETYTVINKFGWSMIDNCVEFNICDSKQRCSNNTALIKKMQT